MSRNLFISGLSKPERFLTSFGMTDKNFFPQTAQPDFFISPISLRETYRRNAPESSKDAAEQQFLIDAI